jgi:hypothetical protein
VKDRFVRFVFTVAGLVILGLGLPNSANAADLPIAFEKAWSKALQTLAIDGMQISASDQQSGVIQFTGTFGDNSEFFDCPRAAGALRKRTYSGSLILKANVDGTTFVMIQTTGVETRYRNHHVLMFRTGSENFENPCRSTGRLETAFIQRLTTA